MEKALGKLIVLALVLGLVSSAFAWPPGYTDIVPLNPTIADVVSISVGGVWANSCIPNGSSISVDGNDIYFDVIQEPPEICLTMITSWEQVQSVGPLAAGVYSVYAGLTDTPGVPPSTYEYMTEIVVTNKAFVLSADSLSVAEGSTATFTVSLLNDPCGTIDVNVVHQSGDTDITVQSEVLLTFDSSNYSISQPVTLAGAEDGDYINGQAIIEITATDYLTSEVQAHEADNDTPFIIYVDKDAPGVNTGTSWVNAFTHLQDALSVVPMAPDIEEIWIAQGVYTPAEPVGDRNAAFNLFNDIIVKGGYAGFGELDPNARDINAYETTLSGDLNGDDVVVAEASDLWDEPTRAENSYHVISANGIDSETFLDGLTIIAGHANNIGEPPFVNSNGGGIMIYNSSGSISIIDCIFTVNSAYHGAGIYGQSSSLELTNCGFSKNLAYSQGGGIDFHSDGNLMAIDCSFNENASGYGGGLTCSSDANILLNNCSFIENSVSWYGGGIEAWTAGSIKLSNCIFQSNSAGLGGGIYSFNSDWELINCLFSGNSSIGTDRDPGFGGGMYNKIMPFDSCTTEIKNCTFVGNSAVAMTGGGIFHTSYYYDSLNLTNCILRDNNSVLGTTEFTQIYADNRPPVINYSCIQGWTGSLGGLGNIDVDPCFVDAGNGDYHLQSAAGRWDPSQNIWVVDANTSRCIDAGNPGSPLGNEAIDGNNTRINMGGYGGTAEASKTPLGWSLLGDLTNNGRVDYLDLDWQLFGWLLNLNQVPGDLNRDGTINMVDTALLAADWLEETIWY